MVIWTEYVMNHTLHDLGITSGKGQSIQSQGWASHDFSDARTVSRLQIQEGHGK